MSQETIQVLLSGLLKYHYLGVDLAQMIWAHRRLVFPYLRVLLLH